MNSGKKPYKIFMLLMLALVLVISWSTRATTRSLRQQVQMLQGELHGLRSQVSHEIGSIRGTVQSIRDDARWYTAPRVDITGVDREKALLKVSWNLREYTAGSGVTLNYRYGKQAFKTIEAVEEANGLFTAEFALGIPQEPVWSLSFSRAADRQAAADRRQAAVAVEEQHWGVGPSRMLLEYYITLQEGDTMRSSEQHVMDLEKLSYSLFNPLNLWVGWEKDGELHVILYQMPVTEPHYVLQSATLESRRGKTQALQSWPLALNEIQTPAGAPRPAPGYTHPLEVRAVPAQPCDSLFLVVEYSGGITVEKEIPVAE